jgi:phosphoglycolate phosphatase/putative hydrolase of the HAD superfamily
MKSKPASEPYLLAAQAAGTPPAACVSVGDRYDVDLAVPLALGMGAILVVGVEDVYALPDVIKPARGRDRF